MDVEQQEQLLAYLKTKLENSCRIADQDYLQNFRPLAGSQGCTCVLVLIVGDRLICVNIGDSRAIMSRNKSVI